MQLKRPLQNTIAATAADAGSRFLGFLATAYLARVLGTSSFGLISIGFSILGYAALMSSPGLHVLGTREAAGSVDPRDDLVSDVTVARVLLALGSIVAVLAGGLALGVTDAVLWMCVFFAAVAVPMGLSVDWFFQGKGDIVTASASRLVMYCVYLAFLLLLVRAPGDSLLTPAAFGGANLVASCWMLYRWRKRGGRFQLKAGLRHLWMLVRKSLPLGVSLLLGQTIINMPVLIAGAMLTTHETGLLSAAMKLLFFVLMIDRVFNTLYFPAASRYRMLRQGEFPRIAGLGLKLMLTIAIPIAVVGVSLSRDAIEIVYGSAYIGSAFPLQLLFLYFLFTTMNTVAMSLLYADGREKEVVQAMLIGTVALIVLAILAAPAWRAPGIAAALAVSEGLTVFIMLWKVRATVSLRPGKIMMPILLSGFLMVSFIVSLRSVPDALVMPLSVVLFLGAVRVLRGINDEDICFLKEKFL